MFEGPSAYAESVDNVMLFIVGISVLLLVGITAAMIYFAYRYHKSRNPKAKQIEGHVGLEVIWIGLPTVLVIIMFFFGYSDYKNLRINTESDMDVHVTAQMWKWSFQYPNGKKSDTLYIPVDKVTKLRMKSLDVNHSLYIPDFRLKEDVIAGFETFIILTPNKTGVHDIACAEYCGKDHAYMYTELRVVSEDEFNTWVNTGLEPSGGQDTASSDTAASDNAAGADSLAAEGEIETDSVSAENEDKDAEEAEAESTDAQANLDKGILFEKSCITCHSFDGSEKLGPTFKGIAKRKSRVINAQGKEVLVDVDDDYLRRALLKPNVEVVKGYPKYSMPNQRNMLTDQEIEKIIMVLKTLN